MDRASYLMYYGDACVKIAKLKEAVGLATNSSCRRELHHEITMHNCTKDYIKNLFSGGVEILTTSLKPELTIDLFGLKHSMVMEVGDRGETVGRSLSSYKRLCKENKR